jgi:hypothetical protein
VRPLRGGIDTPNGAFEIGQKDVSVLRCDAEEFPQTRLAFDNEQAMGSLEGAVPSFGRAFRFAFGGVSDIRQLNLANRHAEKDDLEVPTPNAKVQLPHANEKEQQQNSHGSKQHEREIHWVRETT